MKMASNSLRVSSCFCLILLLCSLIGTLNGDIVTKKSPKSGLALVTVNEDDWDQMLNGEWMVEFHAPWCPACRALQPEWKSFSSWSSDLGIKVGAVDVTANPGLSGRFMVTALPTIYHVKDGVFRQYKGTRDTNSFVSFIEEKKWQSVEPVSSWKAPNSVQMSIVSYFFKISMALRSVHNSLVEDYGIPYWGSYVLFAFATIIFGAILGLIIVCVIDVIFPAKLNDEAAFREYRKSQDKLDDSGDSKKNDDMPSGDLDDDIDTESDGNNDGKTSSVDEDEASTKVVNSQSEETDDDQKKKSIRKRRARRADD